jgi:hypothetical protein
LPMPPGPCTHKTLKRSLGSMEPVGTSASFGPGRQSICAMRQVIDWCPPLATEIALTDLIAGGYLDRHLHDLERCIGSGTDCCGPRSAGSFPLGTSCCPPRRGCTSPSCGRTYRRIDRFGRFWRAVACRSDRCGAPTISPTQQRGFLLASEEFLPHRSCLLAGSLPNRWRKLRKLTVTAACARTAVEWSCIELQMAWRVAI